LTIVVDASVVVASLVDSGDDGTWADELIASETLVAPHLMPVEVANVLRRRTHSGDISADTAALAHADLLDLRVGLFPYHPLAARIWDLRGAITAYDAWYVALAERLGVAFATLDQRLSRSTGLQCEIITIQGT
jgi:predicted nucleic acid-binding protein